MKKRVIAWFLILTMGFSLLGLTAYAEPEENTGACGEAITWNLSWDGALTLSGSGRMPDLYAGGFPWSSRREEIRTVEIGSGITYVAAEAFCDCPNLTGVSLSGSVTDIGYAAFARCGALGRVSLPSGLRRLASCAFEFCASLSVVTIPGGAGSVENGVFTGCTGLQEVTIGAGVSLIGTSAFEGCSSLRTVTFQGDAPAIDVSAFSGVSATMRYPVDNATWTAGVMGGYGGSLTWQSYGEAKQPPVEEPPAEEKPAEPAETTPPSPEQTSPEETQPAGEMPGPQPLTPEENVPAVTAGLSIGFYCSLAVQRLLEHPLPTAVRVTQETFVPEFLDCIRIYLRFAAYREPPALPRSV